MGIFASNPAFVRAQIKRQLVPGAVIKLIEMMDDGRLHEKRFVVLAVSETSICCVINSQIAPYIQSRPHMLQCQVAMPVNEHAFMSHDSHIDCSKVKTFTTDRVIKDLSEKPAWVLGKISLEVRDQMVSALKFAPTNSVKEAENFCAELAAIS